MCGIAGIRLKGQGPLGISLVEMLDGCQHRGADSTGFALYGPRHEGHYALRLYPGLGCLAEGTESYYSRREAVADIIAGLGGNVLRHEADGDLIRMEVDYVGDIQQLSYEVEAKAGVEIFSIGRSLEIIKDVGTSRQVDAKYHVSSFEGTHGIGHVRLATESRVDASRAHPFLAYGFSDVAIVHNGQITNYFKLRRRLERRGYQFRTDNDSEVIAVYIADRLSERFSLQEALEQSIYELDGTFSFLVSTAEGFGFAKDRLGAKPLVVAEKEGIVAVASEEVSLQRFFDDDALVTYEPFPGTAMTWLN